jgi:hypothetical protein
VPYAAGSKVAGARAVGRQTDTDVEHGLVAQQPTKGVSESLQMKNVWPAGQVGLMGVAGPEPCEPCEACASNITGLDLKVVIEPHGVELSSPRCPKYRTAATKNANSLRT